MTDTASPVADPATTPVFARRTRGQMEDLLRTMLVEIVASGDLTPQTPHALSNKMAERFKGTGAKPSTGAIADNLRRWAKVGYIELQEKPLAFMAFTAAAAEKGLAALKAEAAEARSAEKAAKKTAAKAEPAAPAAEPEVAVEPETIEEVDPGQPDVEPETVEAPVAEPTAEPVTVIVDEMAGASVPVDHATSHDAWG